MRQTTLNKLKAGDFFTLNPYEEPDDNKVYVRDEYDRATKKILLLQVFRHKRRAGNERYKKGVC